jgi:hypothetical protein
MQQYASLQNVPANGQACQMLVSVCLLGSDLTVHAKPEKLMLPQDTTGI